MDGHKCTFFFLLKARLHVQNARKVRCCFKSNTHCKSTWDISSRGGTHIFGRTGMCRPNPNSIIHHQTSQKLSPKHAARGVAQSPYPIYRHRKACLSKQPPWRAAGDPRLARGRSRVRAPGPAGALRALFFSTLPSFLLREIVFFAPSPPNPRKC